MNILNQETSEIAENNENALLKEALNGELVILTYRDEDLGDLGLQVGLFNTREEAEAQAIAWIKDDYFQHTVETMSDVRSLEMSGNFAIDFFTLAPGETWETE